MVFNSSSISNFIWGNSNMNEKKNLLSNLEEKLDFYLVQKAPFQIPENGKLTLVKIAPWLAIIAGVLGLIGLFSIYHLISLANTASQLSKLFGQSTKFAGFVPLLYLSLIALVINLILIGLSIQGLFNNKKSAWNLLFYSQLIGVVANVVQWLSNPLQIFSLIWTAIIALVTFYILFQVRQYYVN
jgi:hypothetical protein